MKSNNLKRFVLYMMVVFSVLSVFLIKDMSPTLRTITITDCFDTVTDITVYSRSDKSLTVCTDYISAMHKELSPTDKNSTLYKYNMGENVSFSQDAQSIIEFGAKIGTENPDYFSIFLNPLISAWNIKENTGDIPDISSELEMVKAQKEINLGAVAKGTVCDSLVKILKRQGVSSALINMGGNTYALGTKPDGSSWNIGIQSPKSSEDVIGILRASNIAVVTSGDYERYFEKDGIRYHHILDPKTGYPSTSGLHSVTIVSENAGLADALSTTVFVAGLDKGKEILKNYGVSGILITDDTVYFSKELENIFKQKDFSYKYEFIY